MMGLVLIGLGLISRCKFFQKRRKTFLVGGAKSVFMTEVPIEPQPLVVVPVGIGNFALSEFFVVIRD